MVFTNFQFNAMMSHRLTSTQPKPDAETPVSSGMSTMSAVEPESRQPMMDDINKPSE
jgi:hypothetical protein